MEKRNPVVLQHYRLGIMDLVSSGIMLVSRLNVIICLYEPPRAILLISDATNSSHRSLKTETSLRVLGAGCGILPLATPKLGTSCSAVDAHNLLSTQHLTFTSLVFIRINSTNDLDYPSWWNALVYEPTNVECGSL